MTDNSIQCYACPLNRVYSVSDRNNYGKYIIIRLPFYLNVFILTRRVAEYSSELVLPNATLRVSIVFSKFCEGNDNRHTWLIAWVCSPQRLSSLRGKPGVAPVRPTDCWVPEEKFAYQIRSVIGLEMRGSVANCYLR